MRRPAPHVPSRQRPLKFLPTDLLPVRINAKDKTMKTQLLPLAAGALLSVASLSTAFAASDSEQWLADARAALQARVAAAGLDDDGKTVAIRVNASPDSRRYAPSVARSSGSPDFDVAVRAALTGVRLPAPPVSLNGRGVTFTLGQPAADGAATGAD